MDVTQIPFNQFMQIGRTETEPPQLTLGFSEHATNHLGTLHAGAQFALAEASSGQALQLHFPQLAGMVVPVLRRSEIKFKNPANSSVRAAATIAQEEGDKFKAQLHKKGRATITVGVDLLDQDDKVTLSGTFEWYIQKIESPAS